MEKIQGIERILGRGIIVDVIPSLDEFKKALSERKMRFYMGFDPTSTALHLSHAKNIMLLEEFRRLGHEIILLFGDFTARIGDPSGKESARIQLSKKEVLENVKKWKKQIKPLMDFDAKDNPPKILYNSRWLSKLSFEDVINLASNFTVQQMLERDMFEKRIREEKPIYLHEFFYPLMQGYDSAVMEVDAELCGTDQIFNALAGRALLKKLKNKDKFVVVVGLMANPKTGEMMSKSRGTGVFIDVSPFDLYGAIMAQPDEMIEILLVNNTRISLEEIRKIIGGKNPRDAKMMAALEIVKIFHGEKKAKLAEKKFIKLVQKGETDEKIPEVSIGAEVGKLFEVLKKCLPEASNGELRRLINQKAVEINGKTAMELDEKVESGAVLRVGKKKWFKIAS